MLPTFQLVLEDFFIKINVSSYAYSENCNYQTSSNNKVDHLEIRRWFDLTKTTLFYDTTRQSAI